MSVGFDPGDPRGWGISPIEAENGTGRAPRLRLTLEDFLSPQRPDGLTLAELDDGWGRTQEEIQSQLLEAYGLPEEFLFSPMDRARSLYEDGILTWEEAFEQNEELIRSTRAEFPHDPLGYGRYHPSGPSHWTPPDNPDEKIRSCP